MNVKSLQCYTGTGKTPMDLQGASIIQEVWFLGKLLIKDTVSDCIPWTIVHSDDDVCIEMSFGKISNTMGGLSNMLQVLECPAEDAVDQFCW